VKPTSLFPGGKFQELTLIPTNRKTDLNFIVSVTLSDETESKLVTATGVIQTNREQFFSPVEERAVPVKTKDRNIFKIVGKVLGYVLAIGLIGVATLSYTGHMKARVVLTGSMKPTINPGDLIITIPVSARAPKKGDVVAYIGRRFDGSSVGIFSHRIISGDAKSGFLVKGDANPSPDVQRPKLKDITGIVVFVIPLIGRLLVPKTLFVLIPVGFGLWFIWDALKND
jgi:signal peptidase